MEIADCLKFANENPVCFLATSVDGIPRVRAIGLWFADEHGFYFQSGSSKEMCIQIRRNPQVEVCFYRPGGFTGTTMRVCGAAEFVEEAELKMKVIKDRPFLKSFGLDPDSPELVIFRISSGSAYFWDMRSNFKSRKYIDFGKPESIL